MTKPTICLQRRVKRYELSGGKPLLNMNFRCIVDTNGKSLVLRGIIVDGEAETGVEHEGKGARRGNAKVGDRGAEQEMNAIELALSRLLGVVDKRIFGIVKLPTPFHANGADRSTAGAGKMEMEFEAAKRNLGEAMANKPRQWKVSRYAIHDERGCRLRKFWPFVAEVAHITMPPSTVRTWPVM